MPSPGIQDLLRERGGRLTRQLRILLDLIDRSGLHLDAESLYQLATERDPKLNRELVDELDLMHHSGDQHYCETRLKNCPHCRALRAQEVSKPANA